ncbi:MAG: 23S rRNA (uracil(1939)-C(5))-methyltransferase RlmD [Bacteroidota bacterium]
MGKRKFKPYVLENIEIVSAGSEGKAIARHEGQVIFVDFAVPGDVVDLYVHQKKKTHSFARIEKINTPSPERIEPFCSHFGICGGCKWQHMGYDTQLKYKQQQVIDAFERIGKFPFPTPEKIIGSDKTQYYRNKLEFSFTDKKWLETLDNKDDLSVAEHKGLGFHMPGKFDKILDVQKCYLMDDLHNEIRNSIKAFCVTNEFDFFNARSQEGFMRNMILRNTSLGEWMLIVIFKQYEEEKINLLMEFLKNTFPQITSLLYVVNGKMNDTIHDLEVKLYAGKPCMVEQLEDLKFNVQPKSFFQTNTEQTFNLYNEARKMANLQGNEIVYDLYTGVGSIANFVARQAKSVIGIEYVEQAIVDAKENAAINNITNTHFYAGDMKDILTDELIAKHGQPNVIITDPPRAGMHPDVITQLLAVKAARIVYVSCNPASQARDIAMMQDVYEVKKVQAVDMFPHTHHVECVTLLELK